MTLDKWSNAMLDSMRQIADPPADGVVAAVINAGGAEAVNVLMRHLVGNRDLIPESLPKMVKDFLPIGEFRGFAKANNCDLMGACSHPK